MQAKFICCLGLFAFIVMAWLISSDRRRFPFRIVIGGLMLQFVLAYAVLRTTLGKLLFDKIGEGFTAVLKSVDQGSGFVFTAGGEPSLDDSLLGTFAFGVLPTVIFFSSLMSMLYYLGIMQRVVLAMAWVMRFTLGTSGAETVAAAANVFVGHTEAPLVVRPYLATMTRSELCAMMTGGFATVTGGLLGAYAGMGIEITHLLTASVISAPAALLVAKVMVPETEPELASKEIVLANATEQVNLIASAVDGAAAGLKLALNIGAMVIAFLALIALVDMLLAIGCSSLGLVDSDGNAEITLGVILGYACWPLAWLMGIPSAECVEAGRLIGLKTVANEFIAYEQLGRISKEGGVLSQRSVIVLTYALAGFSNFGSIGIQVGGIGGLEPSRKNDVAQLGLRAMFGGLLACCMTGAVAGLML